MSFDLTKFSLIGVYAMIVIAWWFLISLLQPKQTKLSEIMEGHSGVIEYDEKGNEKSWRRIE